MASSPAVVAIDIVALTTVLSSVVFYHLYLYLRVRRRDVGVVLSTMLITGPLWVQKHLRAGDPASVTLAVQTLRNTLIVVTFLASASFTTAYGVVSSIGKENSLTLSVAEIRGVIVSGFLFLAFLNFALTLRAANHIGFLIGGSAGRAGTAEDLEAARKGTTGGGATSFAGGAGKGEGGGGGGGGGGGLRGRAAGSSAMPPPGLPLHPPLPPPPVRLLLTAADADAAAAAAETATVNAGGPVYPPFPAPPRPSGGVVHVRFTDDSEGDAAADAAELAMERGGAGVSSAAAAAVGSRAPPLAPANPGPRVPRPPRRWFFGRTAPWRPRRRARPVVEASVPVESLMGAQASNLIFLLSLHLSLGFRCFFLSIPFAFFGSGPIPFLVSAIAIGLFLMYNDHASG